MKRLVVRRHTNLVVRGSLWLGAGCLGGLACQAALDDRGRPAAADAAAAETDAAMDGTGTVNQFDSGPLPDSTSVVLSELMYAPVDEQAEVEGHEFIEIYNRGTAPVALDGWKLATGGKSAVAFTFPAKTTIAPGQYRVIAKNRHLLAMVYGLPEQDLLGDYAGELDNGGARVQLMDASGEVMDALAYDDQAPWPMGADALGVSESWLSEPIASHRYRGRSLERISSDFATHNPANWEASALDGATPGKPNSVAGTVLPIVEAVEVSSDAGGGLIRKDQGVIITARFSKLAPVEGVEVELFADDVSQATVAPSRQAMTAGPDGTHSARIAASLQRNDSAIVRYRIRALRGGTSSVVAPRSTDPLPRSKPDDRDGWLAYFVSPVVYVKPGVETTERTYHLFIRPADWTKLEEWIEPGRESGTNGCALNPDWDSTAAATFVSEWQGKAHVYDVRVRYEGGRSQRRNGAVISGWTYPGPTIDHGTGADNRLRALSWRIKFPKYDRFEGRRKGLVFNKMWQGCPGVVSYVESRLLEKAGLPFYREDFGRLHVNGGYFHYVALPEDIDDALLRRLYPDEPVVGDLFKNDGWGAPGGTGPANAGNFASITASQCQGKYKPLDIYKATYPRQLYEWRPYDELVKLITDLDVAKKKDAAAKTHDNVRKYFMDNWDWQGMVTTYVVRNWAGAWDDVVHNSFFFKRPSTGKWIAIQQDFELDFGTGNTYTWPYNAPYDPNQTLYWGWNSPDPWITQECELPNHLAVGRCNSMIFNLLKDAVINAFKPEFDARMVELTRSPDGILSDESVSAIIDEGVRKFSMDDWMADPALKACHVGRRIADLYAWTRARNATVERRLGPSARDAGAGPAGTDAGSSSPVGGGGMAIDWTKCSGGDQPDVSASDFCGLYRKICGFGGAGRYADQADCRSKYAASTAPSCRAGQLCFASNYVDANNGNDTLCRRAAGFVWCDSPNAGP